MDESLSYKDPLRFVDHMFLKEPMLANVSVFPCFQHICISFSVTHTHTHTFVTTTRVLCVNLTCSLYCLALVHCGTETYTQLLLEVLDC